MADNFEGLVLSDESKNRLNGDSDLTKECENFFDYILKSKAEFKICLNDSCYNLMYTIYRTKFNKPDEKFEKSIYTTSAFIKLAPWLACSYAIYFGFPHMLFFVDYLDTGKEVSQFLDKLLEKIIEHLKILNEKYSINIDSYTIECDFKQAIEIRALMTSGMRLMRPLHHDKLSYNKDIWFNKNAKSAFEIFNLLNYRNSFVFSTTNNVLSLYINKEDKDTINSIRNGIEKNGFIKVNQTSYQDRERWIRIIKNANGDVVAVYTFGMDQSKLGFACITPQIITSNINEENCKFFISKIDNSLNTNQMELILNYNLLLLIQSAANLDNLVNLQNLDVDKINLYQKEDFTLFIKSHLKPFLSLNEIDEFIINSTKNSKVLFSKVNNRNTLSNKSIIEVFENILIQEHIDVEKRNIMEKKGERRIIFNIENSTPIYDLFIKLKDYINCDEDIINIMNRFFQFIDLGRLEIEIKEKNINNNIIYEYNYKKNKLTSCIYLERYEPYFGAYDRLKPDILMSWGLERVIEKIQEFFHNSEIYKEKFKDRFPYELMPNSREIIKKLSEIATISDTLGIHSRDYYCFANHYTSLRASIEAYLIFQFLEEITNQKEKESEEKTKKLKK